MSVGSDTSRPRPATGMVLGKFLPPHEGHRYLVDFACEHAERVTVLAFTLPSEPIPGALRAQWLREICPRARIVHVERDMPQEPEDHPEFWRLWHDAIREVLPEGPDCVYASEPYGARLAEVLGATWVPVDVARELVPCSGRAIRADPLASWAFLPAPVRAHYALRISIVGPESTGKTTLARDLAHRFRTVRVHEYARPLLDLQDARVDPDDIPRIAAGQIAAEEAMARHANRLLFCDTDLLTTVHWSEELFGACPDWIRDEARRRRYDLTIVPDIDVPWVADPQRFRPEARAEFLARDLELLVQHGRRHAVVSGGWEARLEAAVAAVEALLAERSAWKPEP